MRGCAGDLPTSHVRHLDETHPSREKHNNLFGVEFKKRHERGGRQNGQEMLVERVEGCFKPNILEREAECNARWKEREGVAGKVSRKQHGVCSSCICSKCEEWLPG